MRQIVIRQASEDDAQLIASAVVMAIGGEESARKYCGDDYMTVLEELARMETSQYSWHNALVAEVDGALAGTVIGYDGARLQELRSHTFDVIRMHIGTSLPFIEDETGPGEFYLDSIAVLPAFRGCGVGGRLLAAMRDRALAEGHERVGLLVDFGNPDAERLYLSLGFTRVEERKFLGHDMWHLQYCRK